MTFTHQKWRRYSQGGKPVYFSTEEPNWFAPNSKGEEILRRLYEGHGPNGDPNTLRFLARIPRARPAAYTGRADCLSLAHIREFWLHLTDQCNMACGHCLFSSSPRSAAHLSAERAMELSAQAHRAGCRLFALTGGEPLIHPGIDAIVKKLLGFGRTHVVLLTNGLELAPFLQRLEPDPDFFHLQISLDGLEQHHDRLRGKGAFARLSQTLRWLQNHGVSYTLSMCVTSENAHQMPEIVDFAASAGAGNVHFMWYFIRGRGKHDRFAPIDTLFDGLVQAAGRAARRNIPIDNLEALKTQVFAPAGTFHDGGTAAWESLAVGPDEKLYPSAALVGMPELASDLSVGLTHAWRHSPVLRQIRKNTVADQTDALRFILGGGDPDHSYLHSKTFVGGDPYAKLHEKLALWLIRQEADQHKSNPEPGLLLQMGEVLKTCGAHGRVALVHSNCLLAATRNDSLTTVKDFYTEAATDTKTDILNPVCHEPSLVAHIPEQFRLRGYGCGSPVMEAGIKPGERVLDIGCGSGVECFIAARLTGKRGKVIGVDMLDPMLALARQGRRPVAENLGYDNLEFKKGYVEALPVDDASIDVVISNCVMNLSVHKRGAYAEILRILRPGGRLVIADVVCETEPDAVIRNDAALRGACIAGALTITHLTALLEETGFEGVTLIKRFPYREVRGHAFFSLTYSAVSPVAGDTVQVMYRGPLPYITTQRGRLLQKGAVVFLDRQQADLLADQVFILDEKGRTLNSEAENSCACGIPTDTGATSAKAVIPLISLTEGKQKTGCMACGAPLSYASTPFDTRCIYCGMRFAANSACQKGHYVCDQCHARDAVTVIRQISLHTDETDMLRLLDKIRRHPAIPVHGPEHHALTPAVILAVYRNLGGDISKQMIETGIAGGSRVAGGSCGFMGVCGAAAGVGIAMSLLLEATPLKAAERKRVQSATAAVLTEIAKLKAARCCLRECWTALRKTAQLSESMLPIRLRADFPLACGQRHLNKECLGPACRLHPDHPR